VVAGATASRDGNVSGNHGSRDLWVVGLDVSGNLLWQRCLGGSGDDEGYSVQQTADGGYVVAGGTASNDGDVSGNHGGRDLWVVGLDGSGNPLWQRCLGGSKDECAQSIQQTADGGYVVAGQATSPDGDVGGTHGKLNYSDYWVVKLDHSGNPSWKRCLGGRYIDEARSIQQTADGGYVVAGYSYSDDGDATGNHGNTKDFWVVKLDSSGSLSWQRSLGGFKNEEASSVSQTADGGYITAGYTESHDSDVIGKHGARDIWVVRLDPTGQLLWQDCLGGSGDEEARSIQTIDGGYVVAGATASDNGDVSGCQGGLDFWVAKLKAINCTITAPDVVSSGSAGNVASTAEPGAAYAWSITNGEITSPKNAQSINFTAGAAGNTTLRVAVTGKGCAKECSKNVSIASGPYCTIDAPAAVCAGSTGNVASTSTAGTEYAWSIINGEITSASDGPSISFTAGASGAVKLDLTVTAADGSLKKCSRDIAILHAPDCGWSSDSPVCNGTSVQFSAPAGMDSYYWEFGDNAVSSAKNPAHLYSAAGTYTVRLKATKDGCSKECSKDITVTSAPDCTITAPSSVCAGSTGNTASTAAAGSAYAWSITNGEITSASNVQSITFTAEAAGTTTLKVKVTAGGCSSNCTKDIAVAAEPDCNITAPDSICAGASGQASTAASGAIYGWEITNGKITSASNTQSITFTAGASGAVGLKVNVTAGGCSKECSKDVTITSGPDCTITAPSSVCAGSTGNSASTGIADAYAWSITNGQITSASNAQSITFTAGASGTTTLKVNVTADGCSKECMKEITITAAPDCSWTSNTPVCDGTPVQLTGPAGMDAYHWEFGDGQTGSAKDPAHLYSAPSSYTVSLTAAKGGCSKTCTGSVEVRAPDCSWTSNAPVCNGMPVQFTGPAGMDSWYWEFGDGQTNTSKDPSHLYSAVGTYTVSLKVTAGSCSKECSKDITIFEPNCAITAPDSVCAGSTGNAASTAAAGAAYSWSITNGNITSASNTQSITFTAGSSGITTLKVKVTSGGCSKSCTGSVEVKPMPDCSWTSNSPVNNGTPVQFTGPAGMDSYQWSFGDGAGSTAQSPSRKYSKAGSYDVNLTVSKDGCSRSCAGEVEVRSQCSECWCSNSPVCDGTAVVFDAVSGMDSYVWDFDDGTRCYEEDPVHLYSAPGKYLVVLTIKKGNHIRSCPDDVVVKP
jgi:PKD repeat protein